jgi:hypothetical protein
VLIGASRIPARFMPYDLKVELTQTRDPSDAELFAAKLLGDSKGKITEGLAGVIAQPDPDVFARQKSILEGDMAIASAEAELAVLVGSDSAAAGRAEKIRAAEIKVQLAKDARAQIFD